MAPFLRSPVVAALRPCAEEGPKRRGGLFYREVVGKKEKVSTSFAKPVETFRKQQYI